MREHRRAWCERRDGLMKALLQEKKLREEAKEKKIHSYEWFCLRNYEKQGYETHDLERLIKSLPKEPEVPKFPFQ